jgi:signal transduction histidine kinase
MNARGPWLTLLLLGAIALAIAVAGARLSRQVETVRLEREHEPLRQFEETLQKELARLDALYEQHLLRVAQTASREPRKIREEWGWLVGLRQYSVVHTPGLKTDLHVPIDARIGERLPEPILFQAHETGLPRPRLRLSTEIVFQSSAEHGWISQTGRPLLFWRRLDADSAVVLLLDQGAIRTAVNGWLASWGRGAFTPVAAAGGPDALLAPDDQPVLTAGAPQGRANLLLPLRTNFGTWHLASWDHFGTRERYHAPTLLGACAAALLVGVLGVFTFLQQRSALRLAAQRVSFVNSVSHELRTPLTNMLLNLDLVSTHTMGEGAPRLALVREEAGRLGRLIENVLTFSRGEQGQLTLRACACQPSAVLEAVLEQFNAAFARRSIAVRREIAAGTCVLDGDALAQIAANLLSNVEKYAAGSEVAITASLSASEFALTVADTGPGIPAHATDRIFRPFERLDSRLTEGATGTGLGLAIARELAVCMGGTLRLLPSAHGAVFELRVPAGEVQAPRIDVA